MNRISAISYEYQWLIWEFDLIFKVPESKVNLSWIKLIS
jgi:hypothetical protein